MARRVIASDGTRLAPLGVDQHWLMVQGGGVDKRGSYLHGTALPYTRWFVITRNSLSLSLSLCPSPSFSLRFRGFSRVTCRLSAPKILFPLPVICGLS